MSRSDAPRADARPGVFASEPEERSAPSPTPKNTLAHGVASARRDPPPPPSPRPAAERRGSLPAGAGGGIAGRAPAEPRARQREAAVPESAPEQRDSSSLLDLVARPPEELHLRFEPISGIAPSLPGHAVVQPSAAVPPQPRARVTTPPLPGPVAMQASSALPPQPRARVTTPAPAGAFDGQRVQAPALQHGPGLEAPSAAHRQASGVQRSQLGAEARGPAPQPPAYDVQRSAGLDARGAAPQAPAYDVPRRPDPDAWGAALQAQAGHASDMQRAAAMQAQALEDARGPELDVHGAAALEVQRAQPRARTNTPEAAAYERARETVAARAAATPRLTLREPSGAPQARPSRARYWIYGVALGLGAVGLVAAGYSAAIVQLASRGAPAPSAAPAAPAPTETTIHTAVAPMPAEPPAAAPSAPVGMEAEAPSAAAQPEQPAASAAAPAKPVVKHAWRARSAPPEPSAAPVIPEPSDTRAEPTPSREAEPAAPEPRGTEPSTPQPSVGAQTDAPGASDQGTPRLVITPLPDGPAAISGETPTPGEPTENLPAQPGREEVQQILLGMRDKLATCATGQHGTSYANVTINGNGRVGHTTIDGAFAGTPAGSCMARTLRGATFPRFSGPQLTVRYPYIF